RRAPDLTLCGTVRSSSSELLPGLVGIEQVRTPLVDDHPLIRQQLIIFPGLGMDLEQLPLCHALAVANKVIDTFGIKAPIWCWFNDQRIIFSTLGDHVIFQGNEKHRQPRVTLAPRTA